PVEVKFMKFIDSCLYSSGPKINLQYLDFKHLYLKIVKKFGLNEFYVKCNQSIHSELSDGFHSNNTDRVLFYKVSSESDLEVPFSNFISRNFSVHIVVI